MKAANPELVHKHAFGQAVRNTKLHLEQTRAAAQAAADLEQTRAAAREAAVAITALGREPVAGTQALSPDVVMQAGLDPQPARQPVRAPRSRRAVEGRAHPYCRT